MNILVSGNAKVDVETIVGKLYNGTIVLVLVIDKDTDEIKDADCSLVTDAAKNCVKEIFVGQNICDLDKAERCFNERYFGNSRKPILFAFRVCASKYNIIKEKADLDIHCDRNSLSGK